MAWGQGTGVVQGYDAGTFATSDSITREQLALMMYRYSVYKGMDTGVRGDLSAFTDGSSTSDWAVRAMEWAVGAGLIMGHSDGSLDAGGYATRAQVAVILQRYLELRFA